MSEVDSTFDIICRKLPENGIDFLLIGGHAVNHYGYTRATQDIDFMIATHQTEKVRRIMKDAGFTNISVHDIVLFFNRPDEALRVDFLIVDKETMSTLLENSKEIVYLEKRRIKVPALKDLLAMKIFAIAGSQSQRGDRDLMDVVHLAVINELDFGSDIRPLCAEFGDDSLCEELRNRITELNDA